MRRSTLNDQDEDAELSGVHFEPAPPIPLLSFYGSFSPFADT